MLRYLQLLLQFYAAYFETLQVFRSWFEDVHIIWIIILRLFFFFYFFFHEMNLVMFPTKVNRYSVSCVCNSTYSFMPIPLQIYRCIGHGLKMRILFGYNPRINFVTFLQAELSHFFDKSELVEGILCAQLTLQFWNVSDFLVMVWRCACILDIILRLFLLLFMHK